VFRVFDFQSAREFDVVNENYDAMNVNNGSLSLYDFTFQNKDIHNDLSKIDSNIFDSAIYIETRHRYSESSVYLQQDGIKKINLLSKK